MTRNYTALVSFETAKRLKEAGYTKDYGYQYDANGELTDPAAPGGYEGVCEAPTYADIFDWLIGQNISVEVFVFRSPIRDKFSFIVDKRGQGIYSEKRNYDTWPEAATAAVEEAI